MFNEKESLTRPAWTQTVTWHRPNGNMMIESGLRAYKHKFEQKKIIEKHYCN